MPNSSDTLFRLECVLLFALDVVNGPYIHSCAPANPPEVIRSFLQPSAGAAATTAATSQSTTTQASSIQQRRPDVYADDSSYGTSMNTVFRKAINNTNINSGGDGGSASLPSSHRQGSTPRSGTPLFLNASRLLGASEVASSIPQAGAMTPIPAGPTCATSFTGLSPPTNSTTLASSVTAAAAATAGASNSMRGTPSLLYAQRCLLGLAEITSIMSDESRSFFMENSAPNNASVSEDSNTIFAISPQTNLSESQQTLPGLVPMAGSFAGITNNSMTSNTGGGGGGASAAASAVAAASRRPNTAASQGAHNGSIAASWMAHGTGTVEDNNNTRDTPPLPPPQTFSPAAPQGDAVGMADSNGQAKIPSAVPSDFSISPLTTPFHTPLIAASFATQSAAPDPFSVAPRRTVEKTNPDPPTPPQPTQQHGVAGGSRWVYAATAGTDVPTTGAATGNGRISSYNDVFVPRSEFCRRVLWLYPAESGLLFLYYAEDIPGEHYQRKTLRYSLCLVFCVDKKRVTIGAGLLHELVCPYSVVLTNIAEELREAEVKYAYMSRGLLQTSPTLRQPEASLLSVTSSATNTAAVDSLHNEPGKEEEADGNAEEATVVGCPNTATGTATAAISSGAQKTFRFGRRRLANESTARPGTYHLALVECGAPASAAASAATNNSKANKSDNVAAEQAVFDTPTSFMSPLPPNVSSTDAGVMITTTVDKSRAIQLDCEREDTGKTVGNANRNSSAAGNETSPLDSKGGSNVITAKTVSTIADSAGTTGSHSYTITSKTTAGTTPLSQFDTPFSAPTHETSQNASPTATAATFNAVHGGIGSNEGDRSGGNVETSSASAVSPAFTSVDALTVSPPSSVLMRSRTVSQSGGAFSSSYPALGNSLGTSTTVPSLTAAVAVSSGPGGAPSTFSLAAGPRFAKHPPHPPPSAGSTVPLQGGIASPQCRGGGGGTSGDFPCSHAAHSVNPLNAFITPTTAPQWTPLSELVEELYRCLRYSNEGDGNGDGEELAGTGSTISTAVPGKGLNGSLNASLASRSTCSGEGGSALVGQKNSSTRLTFSSPQCKVRHTGAQQQYSPLTATLFGCSRDALGIGCGGGEMAQVDGQGGGRFFSKSSPSFWPLPSQQQQQQQQKRGDVSVVHLSDRLSFHVRRMAPLQAAHPLHFDHVPVPIVPYDPTMMEWMDMAVHHVFRLVDGVRTVADLVFGVAMGTTTTLTEVYAEALRRGSAMSAAEEADTKINPVAAGSTGQTAPDMMAHYTARSSSANNRDKMGGGNRTGGPSNKAGTAKRPGALQGSRTGGPSPGDGQSAAKRLGNNAKASLHGTPTVPPGASSPSPARARVVSVPIDARPSFTLLPGVRYSVPNSAAAAAAATAISDGQAPPPYYVNVRVAPPTAPTAATVASEASFKNNPFSPGLAAPNPSGIATPQPHISVELPATWVATTGIVVEALLHLELCHLIKIYLPWTESTLYSATPALQRVLYNVQHPARQILAHHLLHIAWMERQRFQLERRAHRRSAAKQHTAQCEHARQQQRRQKQLSTENGMDAVHFPKGTSQPLTATCTFNGVAAAPKREEGKKALCQSPSHHATWLLSTVTAPKSSSSPPTTDFCTDLTTPLVPPPPSGSTAGGSGSSGAFNLGSNAGTHPSSLSANCTLSCSLKHTVCVGAAGKLQMTLTSSLTTSPMLHLELMSPEKGGGPAQCTLLDNSNSEHGLVDGPPPPVDLPYLQRSDDQQHYYHTNGHLFSNFSDGGDASSSSSSRSTSSSSCNAADAGHTGVHSAEKFDRRTAASSSSSSSASSSTGTPSCRKGSQNASLPVSFKNTYLSHGHRPHRGYRPSSPTESRKSPVTSSSSTSFSTECAAHSEQLPHSLPTLLVTSKFSQLPDVANMTDALPGEERLSDSKVVAVTQSSLPSAEPHDCESHAVAQNGSEKSEGGADAANASLPSAVEGQTGTLKVESTASACGSPTDMAIAVTNKADEKRKKTNPQTFMQHRVLQVFIPTDAELARAAAAALCALAKFSNTSLASVQSEMRRMPVWARAFNHWSDRCVRAMVEVAVLNNWLEDVSQ